MCLLIAACPPEAYDLRIKMWDSEAQARAPVERPLHRKHEVVETKVRVPCELRAKNIKKRGRILRVAGGQSVIRRRIRKVKFLNVVGSRLGGHTVDPSLVRKSRENLDLDRFTIKER